MPNACHLRKTIVEKSWVERATSGAAGGSCTTPVTSAQDESYKPPDVDRETARYRTQLPQREGSATSFASQSIRDDTNSEMASKKPTTTPEEWKNRLAEVKVTKEQLNALVADYLFTEGFKDAAENFSREAGISPPIDLPSIESRMDIRRAVQRGDVVEATVLVNELDPELLDTNPTLHFHLLQLHLIELIRQSRISEALLFAQSELAPKGEEHPQFLADLERTMALLAFEMPQVGLTPATSSLEAIPATSTSSKKEGKKDASTTASGSAASLPMPEHIASLLDQSQRLKTATELNAAILTSQSHGKESKLPGLLKMLAWGEDLLEEKGAEFPKWHFHDLLAERAEASSSAENVEMMS